MVFATFNKTISSFIFPMSCPRSVLLPPAGVRGLRVLDREKFLRNVKVPILKVSEDNVSKIIAKLKCVFLKLENFKPVQDFDEGSFKKCIYLHPDKVREWDDVTAQVQADFEKLDINQSNFDAKEIQLTYQNWKYDDIFKAVLPENEEIVSGFSQIGHIIHLNLRDHLLDYKPLIGQVLVDKIKTCRTVVNKSNIIDNTYRNFSMEVIAGDEDYLVTVKENNCNFQFDFSKVYWNPRLGKEHERILGFLKPGDVLFDVFCGVGPFSIPAAKRKCKVYANDLNPDSYKWLTHNAKTNKVNPSLFQAFNQDGKDFICNIFKQYLIDYCNSKEKLQKDSRIHITMNLPALAVEFLKYFKGLIKDDAIENLDREIIVYVYCFATGDDPASIAKDMVIQNIGCDISSHIKDIFDVRNVSPKKEMMRVTFDLTKEVLLEVNSETSESSEPPVKKLCVNKSTVY